MGKDLAWVYFPCCDQRIVLGIITGGRGNGQDRLVHCSVVYLRLGCLENRQ